MIRKPVNKRYSARRFRKTASRGKLINFAPAPMRGGIRL